MIKRILPLLCLLAVSLSAFAQDEVPEQQYAVVNISVCNMRRTPDYDAEMISQAILGTPVHVLAKQTWYQIQTPDTYTGWVHPKAISLMSEAEYLAWNRAEKVIVTSLHGIAYSQPSGSSEPVSDLVGGDRLKLLSTEGWYFKAAFPDGRIAYVPRDIASRESYWRAHLDNSVEAILKTARSMNGFPYIWAGMSPKGMDCSGFVRTVLYMHDIIIPRDAGPQSRVGERIGKCEDFLPGDLIFFGKKDPKGIKDKVSHVAIYLGNKEFIHSAGLVMIGSFDPESPRYDAANTGRMLYASRILPNIDKEEGLNTTLSNPYYAK